MSRNEPHPRHLTSFFGSHLVRPAPHANRFLTKRTEAAHQKARLFVESVLFVVPTATVATSGHLTSRTTSACLAKVNGAVAPLTGLPVRRRRLIPDERVMIDGQRGRRQASFGLDQRRVPTQQANEKTDVGGQESEEHHQLAERLPPTPATEPHFAPVHSAILFRTLVPHGETAATDLTERRAREHRLFDDKGHGGWQRGQSAFLWPSSSSSSFSLCCSADFSQSSQVGELEVHPLATRALP